MLLGKQREQCQATLYFIERMTQLKFHVIQCMQVFCDKQQYFRN